MKPYWPVDMQYPIFQKFGEHPEIYTKRHGHPGIDFATPMRSELYAPCDGVVTAAAYREAGGYGREVFIQAGRYIIIYGHLSRIDVSVGQHVKRTDLIGLSGGDPNDGDKLDGFSSGPHLHFEVRDTKQPWDNAVDPEIWLATDLDSTKPVETQTTVTGENIPDSTATDPKTNLGVTQGIVRRAKDTPNVRSKPDLSKKYDIGDLKVGDEVELLGNSQMVNGIEMVDFRAWVAKEYLE